MQKTLLLILFANLCFPVFLYAQMSSTDKYRMQEQFDKFRNKVQHSSQSTFTNAREVIEDKKIEAGQHLEGHETATEVFTKLAEKSQKQAVASSMGIYLFPVLIIAVIGLAILLLWHQSI